MNEDWSYWLMVTNLALALVVFLAIVAVVVAVVWGYLVPRRGKAPQTSIDEELTAMLQSESHHILVPELGLTAADGGEEIEVPRHQPSSKQ